MEGDWEQAFQIFCAPFFLSYVVFKGQNIENTIWKIVWFCFLEKNDSHIKFFLESYFDNKNSQHIYICSQQL